MAQRVRRYNLALWLWFHHIRALSRLDQHLKRRINGCTVVSKGSILTNLGKLVCCNRCKDSTDNENQHADLKRPFAAYSLSDCYPVRSVPTVHVISRTEETEDSTKESTCLKHRGYIAWYGIRIWLGNPKSVLEARASDSCAHERRIVAEPFMTLVITYARIMWSYKSEPNAMVMASK